MMDIYSTRMRGVWLPRLHPTGQYVCITQSHGTTKPDLNFVLTIANILAVTVTVPTLRTVTEQWQNKEPKKQGDLAQWSHGNLQVISQI